MRYYNVQTWLNSFKIIRCIKLQNIPTFQLLVNDKHPLLLIEERISLISYPLIKDYILIDSSTKTLLELFYTGTLTNVSIPVTNSQIPVPKKKYKIYMNDDGLDDLDQIFNSKPAVECTFLINKQFIESSNIANIKTYLKSLNPAAKLL
ncbi:hypothetical protein LCDV1gp103 [Lymphocystis disease virus 1]|uniref:hypothetical protein n=1 Tax=Fish lymphocystis disease virus TaxID=36363 RepID=UPI0000161EE6|nr:hypothetical protein LCDV1gp103 [Lymphocystis disease virus 1]